LARSEKKSEADSLIGPTAIIIIITITISNRKRSLETYEEFDLT